MAASDYLQKNEELANLFQDIYKERDHSDLAWKVTRFVEIIIEMGDSKLMSITEAAYATTDVLLKYDNVAFYDKILDIAESLETAKDRLDRWADEEIEESWSNLKSTFEKLKIKRLV